MRLKRLDIFGFKSFPDRTTVFFEPGITAIVGPNGCGKSNIADAVLWVLGEQSPRVLRGDRMEDVIFNGSERRRPLGLSEVSLTLEEVEPLADNAMTRYREVCITRRLFRSGESEYLINKVPCRLRDIRDLLMDLGASFKGHGIMEQGKVDELITASPTERRTIIEETAGITKYKLRRAEAERKLEATQQNLLRVRDIISEVGRQLTHLERQAKKAQTYQTLQEEARDLELRLSVREGSGLSGQLENARADHGRSCAQEAELLARRSAQEAQLESLRGEILEQRQGLDQLKQLLHDAESQILGNQHRSTALAGQQRDWREQGEHLEKEILDLQESLQATQAGLQAQAAESQSLAEQVRDQQSQLGRLEDQARALEERIGETSRLLEEARQRAFEQQSAMVQTRNRIAEGDIRLAEVQRRIEKNGEQRERLNQERSGLQQSLEEQGRLQAAHSEQMARVRRELEGRRKELESVSESFRQAEDRLSRKREDLKDKKLRHSMLVDHIQRHLNLQEGARELLALTGAEQITGFFGVLVDRIEAQPQYEKALEAVLQDRLGGLIMEGKGAITQALNTLRSRGSGEITFIPRAPKVISSPASLKEKVSVLQGFHKGIEGHALSLVQAQGGFEDILEALLGDVLIVSDLEVAYRLWEEAVWPGTCVTPEGEVLESTGVLYDYRREGEKKGLLQQRRDVKTLEEAMAALEREVQALEAEREGLQSRLDAYAAQIEGLSRQLHALELEEVEHAKRSEFLLRDLRRLEENLELIALEQAQAVSEQQEIQGEIKRFSLALEAEGQQNALLEAQLQAQQDALSGLNSEKERLQAEMTGIKVVLSGLKEKQANFSARQEQLNLYLDEQNEQLSVKGQRLEDLKNRQTAAVREAEELQQALERLTAERFSLAGRVQSLNEAISGKQERHNALETEHRLCRAELEEAQKAVQQLEVAVTEIRLRLEHVEERIFSLVQITLQEAQQRLGEFELEEQEARTRLDRLKTRLQNMGPVNLAALEEHQELKERHEFLTKQEQDLTQSIESLQKAIAKINQTTRTLFMETFNSLNAKFGEVYSQFFEGGTAHLVLLDPENPLDSGLDIAAQPPGKRLRHIQLLSGGEKALTAISLLFASFLIHPGPFCILDEIDAPLDEVNVGRFTRVLRTLSDRSQMILVTHNKRTMEMSDILYGVTMEEAGASKVVSVKLAEVAG